MSVLQIFDEWTTYEKLVANDYMHHREFFASLMDDVEARLEQPLSVIDIGCGDAQPVLPLLRRFEIESYVGVDQSQPAIDRAHELLTEEAVSFDLLQGSMLEELKIMDGQFDLAIASFSLHHLESYDKQVVLHECRRLLRPSGTLAVIDVFLEEDESRATYFERWQRNARESFTALAASELDALIDHARSCDIPEAVSDYREFGASAGFAAATLVRQDPKHLNKLVLIC